MSVKKLRGVGVDIADVERFRALKGAARKRFLERVFTVRERAYCEKHASVSQSYAGTFAAKEAAFKAAGNGHFLDYEIRRKKGKPEVWRKGRRESSLKISISHADKYAMAFAVAVNK